MRPNLNLMKATLTGALGGLLFGFDTVVIAGAIDALVNLYHLSPQYKGFTVAIGLVGTVIGALGAGQKPLGQGQKPPAVRDRSCPPRSPTGNRTGRFGALGGSGC